VLISYTHKLTLLLLIEAKLSSDDDADDNAIIVPTAIH